MKTPLFAALPRPALPIGARAAPTDAAQEATTSSGALGSYECDRDGPDAVDRYVERVHGPLADELAVEGEA